jgi:hypothetical protein
MDDDIDEARPILAAFSRVGVPIAYFDGAKNGLPTPARRLRGIRLAILDMNLGVTGSDETIASTLVQSFSRIISPENGPYAVIIWTNHPDLQELVTKYIFAQENLPKPVMVVTLKKASFQSGTKRFKIAKLAKALFSDASVSSPLECLLVWERMTFEAATSVTNDLSDVSDVAAADLKAWQEAWKKDALRVLLAISKARAEKLHSAANCIPECFLALNPLHLDRMDHLVDTMKDDLSEHIEGIMTVAEGAKLKRRALVNSMLHLASDGLEQFNPGNLYVFSKSHRPPFIPSTKDVLKDVVQGSGPQLKANTNTLMSAVRVCGVEISPVCDHAQAKLGLSRIVVGLLVPAGQTNLIKSAGFLRQVGPFALGGNRVLPDGVFHLYLNSRLVTSAKPASLKNLKAIARVRSQLLADLQVWTAYQGARQGLMLLS